MKPSKTRSSRTLGVAIVVGISALAVSSTGFMGCANIVGIEEAGQSQLAASGGSTSTSGASALCTGYCNAVLANCNGPFSVYASIDTCLGVCAKLEAAGKAGTTGDQTGNTVQCRLSQALSAKSTGERSQYCPAAGPGGSHICGTDCEGYCVLMRETCPNQFAAAQFNGSLAYCLTTACPSIPTLDAGFNVAQESGNTINCRLYHVSAANADTQTPGIHCPHAAGAAPCAD